VLIALESDLNERERQHIERVDSLEWDWLGYHNAVKELARERLRAEQKLADRKLELDTLQKQLSAFEAKLFNREARLASRKEKVDSDARENRAQAKLLEDQAEQQLATQRKLTARGVKVTAREKKVTAREVKVAAAETRHRARRVELAEAHAQITSLEAALSTAAAERDLLQGELDEAGALKLSALHIPSWDVAQWMLSEVEVDFDQFANRVAFTGEGPFKRSDLEASARELGLQVGQLGARQAAPILVVGREGWNQAAIEAYVGALGDDTELFIFPQELWVAALLVRYNPFRYLEDKACRAAVETFGEGHPVIEWLRSQEFPWPEWQDEVGPPPQPFDGKVKHSPLDKMDYHVGKTKALPASTRRNHLCAAFLAAQLPLADFHSGVSPAKQREYMASWGQPRSRTRLRRMAWHLAMLVTARARLPNYEIAVKEWQADLAWMKREYYSTLMRFQWP
jgi:hypothetical protein